MRDSCIQLSKYIYSSTQSHTCMYCVCTFFINKRSRKQVNVDNTSPCDEEAATVIENSVLVNKLESRVWLLGSILEVWM